MASRLVFDVLLLTAAAALFFGCSAQRQARSLAIRSMRGLSAADRKEVVRGVRGGRAVHDERLAAAAVEWARALQVPCRWEHVRRSSLVGLYVAAALVGMAMGHWAAAASSLLWTDLLALAFVAQARSRQAAPAAEEANRRVLAGTGPGQSGENTSRYRLR